MTALVFVLGWLLIALQMIAAEITGWSTPMQMQSVHQAVGVPFVFHFGALWGDIVLTIVLAHIVHRFARGWSLRSVQVSTGMALALSVVMHWQYAHDALPTAHNGGGGLTVAGWIHGIYMVGALTILIAFYLFSRPPLRFVIGVSVYLFVHVIIGTHTILKWWSPLWFPKMPVVDTTTALIWTGSAMLLAGATAWSIRSRERL